MNNRELSWLAFNERVLQEAQDLSVPLLQRLRFLGIYSNNRDEFVRVRLANLVRAAQLQGHKEIVLPDGASVREILRQVDERMNANRKVFMETYAKIFSEMEERGIRMIDEKRLDDAQREYCRNYYSAVVSPRVVPLILRRTTKIPFLRDGDIYHAIKMSSTRSKTARYAIMQIPISSSCPRFVVLPSPEGCRDIIFVDDIIRLCLDDIFFMFSYKGIAAYTFKVTRDAQLNLDDDISRSLMEKMKNGLENRMHGRPIRLIYDVDMPGDLLELIALKLGLKNKEGFDAGGRYHLMRELMKFPSIRPDLEDPSPQPLRHPYIKQSSGLLNVIGKKDILLHYPYHTFNHFLDFLRETAIDPKVESIHITLYRTAEHSKVVNALINAARNGKKVVVFLEFLARFDEAQNIDNAERLQKEGIKVIYGIDGLKVHCKLVLVERRERRATRGFAYIGTGNFNESTAKIYSDFGLLTSESSIVDDVRGVFDFLLAHRPLSCAHLMVSPFSMRSQFEKMISQEIRNAQKGKKAYIHAKFNSLTDEKIIACLYKASCGGVEIRLIIRGSCCLQAGVPGQSENIKVISIVDKYLEHARLAIFHNGGDERIFILSADWMTRNLDRRVEVGAPILDRSIQKTLRGVFDLQWADNVKARDLSLLCNRYVPRGGEESCRSQMALYKFYSGA
ncbi:MAG: polyphosphate kinase 1 [Synergistaceae bacterium]|jgi:polyphosphate kinase|nr:polyphosphate kinase 1 [Synergistaceae bacterium]